MNRVTVEMAPASGRALLPEGANPRATVVFANQI